MSPTDGRGDAAGPPTAGSRPLADIAHDLNNSLTAIVNFATLIARFEESQPTTRDFAERIVLSATKAAGLTNELLGPGEGEDAASGKP